MALGKLQISALKFAHKHKGWNYFHEDGSTKKLMQGLKSYKLISIDKKYSRFKITKLGNAFIYDHTNRFYL